jgi:hypothetical protein
MCLYFFLAGIAVSTGRLLWLLPLATAASAAVHGLAGAASRLALPFYKDLPAERAALWCVDVAHLVYSALTGEPSFRLGGLNRRAAMQAVRPARWLAS